MDRAAAISDYARQTIGLDQLEQNAAGRGAGQTIGVVDSGIDRTHPDFNGRIIYQEAGVNGGSAEDHIGHGTHVAGIAAGDGKASNRQVQGMAPEANLVVIGITSDDGALHLPVDLGELLDQAREAGASIINLSWDRPLASFYDSYSMAVDAWVLVNPGVLVVIAAGNEGKAPSGYAQLHSVGTPATAKNAVTVGASSSARDGFDETWRAYSGAHFPKDPTADCLVTGDDDQVAALSGRGPSDFGSVKPDVVAPGTAILAARAAGAIGFYWRSCSEFGGRYGFMLGTSMAAPVVSGAAAVLRALLFERFGQPAPQAALLKAMLVCSAHRLPRFRPEREADTFGFPDFDSGFGRLDLGQLLGPSAPALYLDDIANGSDQALESRAAPGAKHKAMNSYHFEVTEPAGMLRTVLAWTDQPQAAIQNCLGLRLTLPDGSVLRGNGDHHYGQPDPSLTDPAFLAAGIDRNNNVQAITVKAAATGSYRLDVFASNTLRPPQGYGLCLSAHHEEVTRK